MSATTDAWRLRARTLEALGWLVAAQTAIGLVRLERWRGHFGRAGQGTPTDRLTARKLAANVRRAAQRLPWHAKCLPQGMALSRLLRRRGIAHALVIAARPAAARTGHDDLHAWVEIDGDIVLGDLPGPWLPLLRLP